MVTETEMGRPSRPRRRLKITQWWVMILLGTVAGSLLVALAQPSGGAPSPDSRPPSGPVIAVAGQLTANTYGLYIVDNERGSLVVYEYVPHDRESNYLQLRAARTLVFDTQLEAYNTAPDPAEIADLVRQAHRIGK